MDYKQENTVFLSLLKTNKPLLSWSELRWSGAHPRNAGKQGHTLEVMPVHHRAPHIHVHTHSPYFRTYGLIRVASLPAVMLLSCGRKQTQTCFEQLLIFTHMLSLQQSHYTLILYLNVKILMHMQFRLQSVICKYLLSTALMRFQCVAPPTKGNIFQGFMCY